jgi:hypothetical protein
VGPFVLALDLCGKAMAVRVAEKVGFTKEEPCGNTCSYKENGKTPACTASFEKNGKSQEH